MSLVICEREELEAIADAIREKCGMIDSTPIIDMPTKILNLNTKNIVFAVYSDDGSLNFYNRPFIPKVNSTYMNKIVLAVYTGFETIAYDGMTDVMPDWYWDENYKNVTSIKFIDKISPISISCWFYKMESLTKIDLTNLDTSNVTNMCFTFTKCNLTELDLSNFNTKKVTNMYAMFSNATTKTINLSNFDTSNVVNMDSMFYNCTNLENIIFSTTFSINKQCEIGYMFAGCTNLVLTELPKNITHIDHNTFSGCKNLSLTKLPESITTIGVYAFMNCTGLITLTFEGTPKAISNVAFNNCTNLTVINVPWTEGQIVSAPWGATNATINYNYTGG